MLIRAIDGGGAGFRRADIEGTEILSFAKTPGPLSRLDELLDFVRVKLLPQTKGIAYAMAGVIENNELVVKSPNAHFLDGVHLAQETKKALPKKRIDSMVFNDMEAAVTGMAALLHDEPYFMGITWSSGIGLQIWSHGKILSLAEGGHTVLDPSPFAPLCGCGKRGHTEAIVGGASIRRRVIAETQTLGIQLPEGKDPCAYLDECYQRDDEWAVNLYQVVAQGMGIFLANIQSILHLPLIVWKGTFALKVLKFLEPEVRATMKGVMIDPSWADENNLRFQFSPDPDHDSFIGAAACFCSRISQHGKS